MNNYTVIFRVIGGDVFEVPTTDHISYAKAFRFVLRWFGYRRNDVILCTWEEWK